MILITACKQCYIGKVALVHLFEANKQLETLTTTAPKGDIQ